MLTVHHLHSSRSERVIWLLEELGEPYEIIEYKRLPNMMAPPEYRALHPIGASPLVEADGHVLMETGAILEYILEKYGRGRLAPERGTPEHVLYLQWFHAAESSVAAGFTAEAAVTMDTNNPPTAGPALQVWRDRNDRTMSFIDDELGRRPYFAGEEFTAADVMMAFALGMYDRFIRRPKPFRNIPAYTQRIAARPAHQRMSAIAARPTA